MPFCVEIYTQFHVYVQNLRSDNAKEYVSIQFQSFMLQHGILHQTSCVDTPAHNGVAERKNGHLLETARALLFQIHVPKHFWVDVVSTICFLINRMPSSVLNWDTPYHILFPNKHLFPIEPQIFGCTCFVRDVRPQVSKLDHKSLKCIFLGYSRVFRKGIGVTALVFVGTWFLRMSSFLRMSLSLHPRPTLVKGRQMTC